jgi:hypothetical protein
MDSGIPLWAPANELICYGFLHRRNKPIDTCQSVQNAVDAIERWVAERVDDAANQMYVRDLNFGVYRIGYWPKGKAKKFVLVGTLSVKSDGDVTSGKRCTWKSAPPPMPKMEPLPEIPDQDEIITEGFDSADGSSEDTTK